MQFIITWQHWGHRQLFLTGSCLKCLSTTLEESVSFKPLSPSSLISFSSSNVIFDINHATHSSKLWNVFCLYWDSADKDETSVAGWPLLRENSSTEVEQSCDRFLMIFCFSAETSWPTLSKPLSLDASHWKLFPSPQPLTCSSICWSSSASWSAVSSAWSSAKIDFFPGWYFDLVQECSGQWLLQIPLSHVSIDLKWYCMLW